MDVAGHATLLHTLSTSILAIRLLLRCTAARLGAGAHAAAARHPANINPASSVFWGYSIQRAGTRPTCPTTTTSPINTRPSPAGSIRTATATAAQQTQKTIARLSVSFPFLVIVALLLFAPHLASPQVVQQNFIVFDNIGKMASSLTYIHVAIPLNLTHFTHAVQLLEDQFWIFRKNISSNPDKPVKYLLERFMQIADPRVKRLQDKMFTLDNLLPPDHSNRITRDLYILHNLMQPYSPLPSDVQLVCPIPPATFYPTCLATYVHAPPPPNSTNPHYRQKRQILAGAAIISGVLGTFMGLFNAFEITNLQNQLAAQRTTQALILDVTKRHELHLKQLDNTVKSLTEFVESYILSDPTLVYAQLQDALQHIQDHLQIIFDTIQQLQHQRLSISLLPPKYLHILHTSVNEAAKSRNLVLLPNHIQDYFQLDTSYIRVQSDIVILLHVPCITSDSLLTIYRYANLPYPVDILPTALHDILPHIDPIHTVNDLLRQAHNLSDSSLSSQALFFVPDADLIAIGRNIMHSHRYKLLSSAELQSCIQRNHVYLCERHQVLRTDLEGSCLGSLYLQSVKGVRENCKLDRKQLRETVYQISANNHIIVTPAPFTTQIQCANGTHLAVRIGRINKVYVPAGCTLQLKNHTITADDNIRITPEPLQFEWDLDPLTLPSELLHTTGHLDDQLNNLKTHIADLKNLAVTDNEFEQILNQSVLSPSSHFTILIWVSVFLAALAFTCLFGWYCQNRRRYNQLRREAPAGENPKADSSYAMSILLNQFRRSEQKEAQLAADQADHCHPPPPPPINDDNIYTEPPLPRSRAVPLSNPNIRHRMQIDPSYRPENPARIHPPLPPIPTNDSTTSLDEISKLAMAATAPPCPHISTFPFYRHPDCISCRLTS